MRSRYLAPLVCLSLIAPGLPCWSFAKGEGTVTVDIPIDAYEIREAGGGHEITMENFGTYLVPGNPGLPSRIFHIAIPPGARVQGVTFETPESTVLPAQYLVTPVPLPRALGEENPETAAREKREYEANYARSYGSDEAYPPLVCELVGPAGYRKYNLAAVRVFPFAYRPLAGELVFHPRISVTVHYSAPEGTPAEPALADNLVRTEALARRIVLNYDDAAAWYPEASGPRTRGLHEVVFITLESLISSIQPLVDWELGKGRTVNVVTTTWIDANYTGYDLAQKMRNFLREKYPSVEWGIEDVCLVGGYDDVPMRRTAQDMGYGQPETDFYYAELSLSDQESWDADGDHQWGDNTDPIDFIAEVNVGRIPWSTPATVQHICEKSIAYEINPDPGFKQNILLLGAFFWDDTDNAVLMEYKTDPILHPWMEDWTRTRMYEDTHSHYPCDYDLTNANVRSVWSTGTYSFVNWAGHGSPTSAHILYNGSPHFISSADCPLLNDDFPAIVFADACSNSDTDHLNIGQAMLQQGAIGFLGATKVAYGMGAWNDPNDGSSQSLDYFFTTCCTSGGFTQGEAHQWSLYEMYARNLWYYPKYETFEWGALWGNPDLSAGYMPILNILFPNGLPAGRTPPGFEAEITLQIQNGQEVYVPGTGKLHYRLAPEDPYTEIDIVPAGEDLFTVTLPATVPGDQPEFYFSAQGDGGTTIYSPAEAPDVVYSFEVCIVEDILHDDFESDLGWTVENFQVPVGSWERCVPNLTSGQQISPVEDNPQGVGTYCFVTGNGPPGGYYRDWDLDGGPTTLTSPVFDLSCGDADVSYYVWHANDDGDDPLEVEISNDGGASWVLVEQVMNTAGAWTRKSFAASDFIVPTDQVSVRFRIADSPNNSMTEAGLDDVRLTRVNYMPSIWTDAYSFPASVGGEITFSLDAGPSHAGREYIVGGSLSGAYPGFTLPGGNVIPLNFDPLTRFILQHLNGPLFQNFRGTLDAEGKATAVLSVPGPLDPSYAGKTAVFAFTLTGGFDFVSNPVCIEIVP